MDVKYDPSVFDVRTMDEAKRIILTPEQQGTDERWRVESEWLGAEIAERLVMDDSCLVLDYGCGIGRLAKQLIGRAGCKVIGCDISPSMRALASIYVDDERFTAVHPEMLMDMVFSGLKFDGVYAVWALQHVSHLPVVLRTINEGMHQGSGLVVVNDHRRFVPTDKGWVDDGIDIKPILATLFDELSVSSLAGNDAFDVNVAASSFIGEYVK